MQQPTYKKLASILAQLKSGCYVWNWEPTLDSLLFQIIYHKFYASM